MSFRTEQTALIKFIIDMADANKIDLSHLVQMTSLSTDEVGLYGSYAGCIPDVQEALHDLDTMTLAVRCAPDMATVDTIKGLLEVHDAVTDLHLHDAHVAIKAKIADVREEFVIREIALKSDATTDKVKLERLVLTRSMAQTLMQKLFRISLIAKELDVDKDAIAWLENLIATETTKMNEDMSYTSMVGTNLIENMENYGMTWDLFYGHFGESGLKVANDYAS